MSQALVGGLVIDGAGRDPGERAEDGMPDDLVVGEADGVIAIPSAEAAEILERNRADNAAGRSDPERFDAALRAKGLPLSPP
ncbi:MAG TPA: hypothetical protein VMR43_16460 [Variovorax sp.]|nr:hypothetical protein [Variovorax sp.]